MYIYIYIYYHYVFRHYYYHLYMYIYIYIYILSLWILLFTHQQINIVWNIHDFSWKRSTSMLFWCRLPVHAVYEKRFWYDINYNSGFRLLEGRSLFEYYDMKVSWNRGTPSHHPNFSGIFHDKPSIPGYPHGHGNPQSATNPEVSKSRCFTMAKAEPLGW